METNPKYSGMELLHWHIRSMVLVLAIIFVLTGCTLFNNSATTKETAASTSGIYKTNDGGDTWQLSGDQYGLRGENKIITYNNITFLKADPQDSNAIYLGTDKGLYYSYNGGDGWFFKSIGKGTLNDIAIHPQNKCLIYAVVFNAVYKSADCARSWERIHFSSLSGEFFSAIIINQIDPDTIFVGSSTGKFLLSNNAGRSWQVKHYLNTPISRFVDHPFDGDSFYMVTPKFGIQLTNDRGISWRSLNELPVRDAAGQPQLNNNNTPRNLNSLKGSNTFLDLKFDTSQKDGLIYASAYGIFRLINGEYWQEIEILNRPTKQKIYSIDIDGADGQTIYFASVSAFYRSSNGGQDWTVKSLPSAGIPRYLLLAGGGDQEVNIGFYSPPK